MLLKRLKLKNIRSYEDEELFFPEGITLLSGDIGCGKSTALIAIEFALFGFIRSDLSGSALLRNGKDSGYVVFDFKIDKKDISIKRTLKKSSNGIVQDSSFISINDITKELTSTELKQSVLELLNYPQDTLTKKSMVYRYTVYTPQEEMKTILLGEKELRFETLRRVFNVDKYKRIKDNCRILTAELKIKKKESAAYIYDLENKKILLEEGKIKSKALKEEMVIIEDKINNTEKEINMQKGNIKNAEEDISKLNNFKKELELMLLNLKFKNDYKEKNMKEHQNLYKEIINYEDIKEINIDEIKTKFNELSKKISEKEIELKEIVKNIINLKSITKIADDIKQKIAGLDNCPMCEQPVKEDHKHNISAREEEKIRSAEEKLDSYIEMENTIEKELAELKKDIEEAKNIEKMYEINKLKMENARQRKQLVEKISNEIAVLDNDIVLLNKNKDSLLLEIEKFKDVENNYLKIKVKVEELSNDHRQLEIKRATLMQQLLNFENTNNQLVKEIEEKEKIKEKLNYYIELYEWLDSFFVNLVELIERKVMFKIYNDFNSLFQNWFSMFMDNDIIKVRLDEEFTPIIEQNGYDIEYQNLSGGEKTACALAYRLALNQVINNIMTNINTRDLIILDEPSDGFSLEQLDKLRNVLQELKMKQVLIVSHENKVESFVDNIIKIKKEGHVSNVVS